MTFSRFIANQIADNISDELHPGRITVVDGVISEVEQGHFAPGKNDIVLPENEVITAAFIDAHGHSDISLMAMPEAESKTAQGIAFEISGNCGLSPFPLTERNRGHLQELYRNYSIKLDWSDYSSYMHKLAQYHSELELFAQVGHNTLRAAVAGYETRTLSSSDLSQMQEILDRELAAGAIGLSSGLLYTPGCFADFEELVALLKVVAAHNKVYTVHLRSEGNELEEALEETLSAARQAGLQKLHLSHLKTAGAANYHKLSSIFNALNSSDLRVSGDVYCYTASMTQLSVILPEPFDCYDDVKNMELLRNENCFAEVLQKVKNTRPADYWSKVQLITAAPPFESFRNMFLNEAAYKLKLAPEELFLQIIRHDAVGATAAFHTLSKENMQKIASHHAVVPGSDESARNLTSAFGSSHPRNFGNHAKYFDLRRSQGASLCEVLREMSARPAEIFGLHNLGTIQKGKRAVFTILDPEKYQAHSTFENPHRKASGAKILRSAGA